MKLLIVKLSSLGDVMHALEAVRLIPHGEIHWVIEKSFAPLVKDYAKKIILADTKKWRKNPFKWASEIKACIKELREESYDFAIDLQGNLKSSLILPFIKSTRKVGFGWKTVPEKINLLFTHEQLNPPPGRNIREDYLFLLEQTLGFKGVFPSKPLKNPIKKILVAPGSAWINKKLPINFLIEFLKAFHKDSKPTFSFLWGNPQEKMEAEALSSKFANSVLLPHLSLDELKELMPQFDLVVAMDSFPLHLASFLGIPTYAFFGPTSAIKYAPLGEQSQVYQGSCPYGRTFEKRCPILRTCPTGACLRGNDNQGGGAREGLGELKGDKESGAGSAID